MSRELTGLIKRGDHYVCPRGCFSTEPFRCEHITRREKALATFLDWLEGPTRPDPVQELEDLLELEEEL